MKKYNYLKFIIGILSFIISILIIFIILLILNHSLFSNNIIMDDFSFIMQLLSYVATIVEAVSIVFAYMQFKNTKKENSNRISNETINMLDDFATKVIPYMNNIDYEYNKLSNNYLDNKAYTKAFIKSKALNNRNYEINYIDLWCKCLLIFKDRNMIQEGIIYDEDENAKYNSYFGVVASIYLYYSEDYNSVSQNRVLAGFTKDWVSKKHKDKYD